MGRTKECHHCLIPASIRGEIGAKGLGWLTEVHDTPVETSCRREPPMKPGGYKSVVGSLPEEENAEAPWKWTNESVDSIEDDS